MTYHPSFNVAHGVIEQMIFLARCEISGPIEEDNGMNGEIPIFANWPLNAGQTTQLPILKLRKGANLESLSLGCRKREERKL
jgi:hypothetical protein